MLQMMDTFEKDMGEDIKIAISLVALIDDIREQGRWNDLPIIALDIDDEETASLLVEAAFTSGEEDIVLSCLKNLYGIAGFPVSTQSLLAFLSTRQSNAAVPPAEDLVAGIAGSAVTMNVIDRYRSMVEQLLAHRS